jgi:hypothetical protein
MHANLALLFNGRSVKLNIGPLQEIVYNTSQHYGPIGFALANASS